MGAYVLFLLVGLQAKHFLADYLLQPGWMIAGKSSFMRLGGYVHVGIHAVGTVLVLALAETALSLIVMLVLAEAVVHYLIDLGKVRWSAAHPSDPGRLSFWVAHGADQFLHQLTYALMLFVLLL
jgi:hypothetical protein